MPFIRPARPEDAGALFELRNRRESVFWSARPPITPEEHEEWIAQSRGDCLVLVDGVEVCGYARCDEDGRVSIAVTTQWAGRGHGRALLDTLADRAVHRGRTTLWADIHPSNIASMRAFMHARYRLDRAVVHRSAIFQRVIKTLSDPERMKEGSP